MELREQLAGTKVSGDVRVRERLARAVRTKENESVDALRAALGQLARARDGAEPSRMPSERAPDSPQGALAQATSALARLRYYRRFLEEVALLEDAL